MVLYGKDFSAKIKNVPGAQRFWGRRELRELAKILPQQEIILFITQGSYQKLKGLVIGTDLRIIFLQKDWLGSEFREIRLSNIRTWFTEAELLFGQLILTGEDQTLTLGHISRQELARLTAVLSAAIKQD